MKDSILILALSVIVGATILKAGDDVSAHSLQDSAAVSFAKTITLQSPVLYPYSIAAGDLNHDGVPDLAVVGIEEAVLEHALGKGDGRFHKWDHDGAAGDAPGYVTFADVDLDGDLDAITTDGDQPLLSVAFGNGKGHFNRGAQLHTGRGYATEQVAVADLNGDGIPDLVGTSVVGSDSGNIFILLGTGHRKFAKAVNISSGGPSPIGIVVGDLNHDGIPDLVVANNGADNPPFHYDVAVLLGNGDGTFCSPVRYFAGVRPYRLTLGDFNGDGNLDVAVVPVNGKSSIFVLLGNGDGTFGKAKTYQSGLYPSSIVAADFNGDGILDLAVTNYTAPKRCHVSVLLGNGDGTFQRPIRFRVGLSPVQVVVADFNHDGKPDIATVNGGDATISILLNTMPERATAKLGRGKSPSPE